MDAEGCKGRSSSMLSSMFSSQPHVQLKRLWLSSLTLHHDVSWMSPVGGPESSTLFMCSNHGSSLAILYFPAVFEFS
ncbi:unnamed protein product [Gadus morhua 'NCC']